MTSPIRVLIAEDQSLVRGALTALLNTEPDIEVVAGCSSGVEVADLVAKHRVDVAILDIEMPGMNGIDAAKTIAATDCRSLIVTTFGRSGYVKRALEAGVDGFLVKDTPPDELADAIRRVHSGLRVIDPQLAQDILLPRIILSASGKSKCAVYLYTDWAPPPSQHSCISAAAPCVTISPPSCPRRERPTALRPPGGRKPTVGFKNSLEQDLSE